MNKEYLHIQNWFFLLYKFIQEKYLVYFYDNSSLIISGKYILIK